MRQEHRQQIIGQLAHCFDTEGPARAFLEELGFSGTRQPSFEEPLVFWQTVYRRVQLGVLEAGHEEVLVEAAQRLYPANRVFRLALQELREDAAEDTGAARATAGGAGGVVPPVGVATSSAGGVPQGGRQTFPTLLFIGSDQHEDLLRLVREEVSGESQLLYAALGHTAVLAPAMAAAGSGDHLARLRTAVAHFDPPVDVSSQTYDYRPYLLRRVRVVGPDQQIFLVENVPVTSTVQQVVAEVQDRFYGETARTANGRLRASRIQLVRGEDVRQVDPSDSLHTAGVGEGDLLRFLPRATAGAIPPAIWLRAVRRAYNAIRAFEAAHPEFRVVDVKDEDVPTMYAVQITAPSFGPPKVVEPGTPVEPVEIDEHELVVIIPSDYPLQAPRIFWHSPIFHPNVCDDPGPFHGFACLGPLLLTYRADLDFGTICQLIVDMAAYRNYELRGVSSDSDGYLNRTAVEWAETPEGQEAILARGGVRASDGTTESGSGRWPLRISPGRPEDRSGARGRVDAPDGSAGDPDGSEGDPDAW